MLSPSVPQIPNSSNSRPLKKVKTAAVGGHEAIGGRAKAERWFNDTNNNACGTKDAPYLDGGSLLHFPMLRHLAHLLLDDPPFYLNEETSSGGASACAVHSDGSSFNLSNFGLSTAPTRSLLAQMEANESNSEDFRSVIDDLTIQNKRLRRKLKKYERLHCSHLQEEKSFEVRIHGLAAHRKRELEGILRSFASRCEESPKTSPCNLEGFKGSAPTLSNLNPSPSTSYSKGSKPIDSAYASMSGQTGVSQKQSQAHLQQDLQAQSQSKQQHVQSYLHDIPATLVPKHSLAMSERAKSRLVVRRLEQIFTGRKAAGAHNQSHQQQEVSQSAAKGDRMQLDTRSSNFRPIREGLRAARILPNHAELKVDSLSEANLATQQSEQTVESRGRNPLKEGMREARISLGCAESQIDSSSDTNLTGQQSRQSTDGEDSRSRDPWASRHLTPDQRPTHPLDLDLQRAQVPLDNIEYIRHLGIASPAATLEASSDSNNGWVFLNLLTSMAQLHTLNVTPEFIRHAVAKLSSKFELSTDGTKVRWQGGIDGTQFSSDSDESDHTRNWKSTDISVPVSKRGSVADLSSRTDVEDSQEPNSALPVPNIGLSAAPEVGAKRRPVYLEQPNDVDKFHYKQLFFHSTASEHDDDSAHANNSVSSSDPMEDATGLNPRSEGIRESEVKLRTQNRKNGPIIFYNKARFCTDLSGDSSGAMHDEAAYCRYTQEPIGCLQLADSGKLDENEGDHVPGGDDLTESMDLDFGSTITTRSALDLEDLKSLISDLSTTTPVPMDVSGLGGIQPEDNFMVQVRVCHRGRNGRGSRPHSPPSSPCSQIRRSRTNMPRSQPDRGNITSEIISTVKTDMPPSSLPPASYLLLPFSSSESDDGDDEDEGEEPSISYYKQKPRASAKASVEKVVDARPAHFFLGSSSDEHKVSSYASTSSGSEDDSSIDFLANARVLDPDTIAAQEREFDFNSTQQPAGIHSVTTMARDFTSSGSETPGVAQTESDVDSMSVDGDAEDD